MSEIPNTSYEEPINNDSLNNQTEGLHQEQSPKSIDEYINDQKKLLLDITDKNLQEHAQEEFQEVQEKFEALRGNTLDTTGLLLADLHQEFQRDISGLNNLEDTKIASMISLEELNVYLSSQTEEFKESFYSIMNNISESVFQAQVLEFNEMYGYDGETKIDNAELGNFFEEFMVTMEHKIEQTEINELINLNLNAINSQPQVDYYKQQILNISKHTQPDEEKALNLVLEKLNVLVISEVKNEEVEVKNEEVEVKNEEVEKASKFQSEYSEIYKNLSVTDKFSELNEEYGDIFNILEKVSLIDDHKLENNDIEALADINKLKSDLLSLLEKTDDNGITVAEKFLQDLGKVSPELYSKTLNLFKNSSDTLKQNLSHLSDIYSEPTVVKSFDDGGSSEIYSALSPNAVISGDKAIDGNKYMDLSVEPPQKYIRLENGFRLNSTVKFPKIITEKEQEFKQESDLLAKEISEGKTDYNHKEFRKNELLGAKEKLDNSEISTDERNKLAVEYPNLEYELSQLTLELNQLDSEITEKENKLDEITEIFNREHKQALDWYRTQVEAKDKKTQEVLKFLEGVGFNLIPQSITNSIIEQLNNPGNSGLRGLVGFNTLLNLSEGELGFHTSLNDDLLGTTEKVIFAEFMNRIISGNIDEPINTKIILTSGDNPVDVKSLNIQLEQSGLKDSGTGISIAMDNLRKSTLEK